METVEQLVTFNHIQIQLNGGAPWGFTLKGGLEHGEPLIITKIEEGGRASQCENLRVGDELVNINGSALYGSRQEALILIKGSYRILKITVRRRTVPVIRPSSWHLAKISDPPLPPPSLPPPPLPSPEIPPPPPPPTAMQLHPGPCPPPWHSADNSDLSVQWGHLSRHYPTDRSSSLGSMESLDPPGQTNYDTQNAPSQTADYDPHLSPVDPAIFNNKRDSAYSSFSASSNASDYTLPLRPGEACSMDNLLQGLGPACRGYPSGDAHSLGSMAGESQDESGLKSRSLTRPKVRLPEARARPSSYCYEEERREEGGGGEEEGGEGGGEGRRGGRAPPQPPTRKDSFRATRGRPGVTDNRCSSALVGISNPSCCPGNDHLSGVPPGQIVNGYGSESPALRDGEGEPSYRPLTPQGGEDQENHRPSDPSLRAPTRASPSPCPVPTRPDPSMDPRGETEHLHPQDKHSSSGLHRHSAPEKLLEVSSDRSDPSDPSDRSVSPPCRQWSHSPLQALRVGLAEDQWAPGTPHLQTQDKWGGSRCSTPGSVLTDGDGEVGERGQRLEGLDGVAGNSPSSIQQHHTWGRSISVPGQPSERFTQGGVNSDRVLERDFGPISAAASMDTLLVDQRGGSGGGKGGGGGAEGNEGEMLKRSSSSRNHRRSRRRSERFATNLRNEIQRKKAQLQKSRGPGGLLYGGDTVHEEEGLDLQGEVEERGAPDYHAQERGFKIGHTSALEAPPPGSLRRLFSASTPQLHLPSLGTNDPADSNWQENQTQDPSRGTLRSDRFRPDCGVGIRVVEEPAPAGKARRWRWTPEHKLQPDHDADQPLERSKVVESRLPPSSSSSVRSSSSRMEESDILTFADRRKFFEETSKSMSVTNLSGLTSRRQRPDRHGRHQHPSTLEHQGGGHCQGQAQRRYSYQGGILQESPLLPNTMEARRQSVSSEREREKERERERMREWEREERAREREREREERMKEREREREEREQERAMELERARLEREREREERLREWERQREREVERERERQRELELERERERELQLERERERELQLERERERELQLEREREIELQLERERERELQLERERERELELERERERELERARERELELERERKKEWEREREIEERRSLSSAQDFRSGLQEYQQNEYVSVQTHVYTQAFPPTQAQNQAPRSAFHPVNNPLSQDNQGYTPRSYTPTETQTGRPCDQSQLYRKFSLTEREFPRRSTDPRPPEGADPSLCREEQPHGRRGARLSARSTDAERSPPPPPSSPLSPPSPSPLRGRAMSENDLRFDARRPHARFLPVGAGTAPALSEAEEAAHGGGGGGEGGGSVAGATRKKTPPPPRPPPPKWEQFHRRRASHHNLFASSPLFHPSASSLLAPQGPGSPPSPSPALPPPLPQEAPRLRSHSLPPQREELHVYQQAEERPLSQAPPSPGFTRRAFRPVAPPHREEDSPPPRGCHGDQGGGMDALPPRPTSDNCTRFIGADSGPTVLKPDSHRQQRQAAEWTRTTSPRGPSGTLENGGVAPAEPYLSASYEQQQLLMMMKNQNHGRFHNHHHHHNRVPEPQQQTLEPRPELSTSPAHSLEAELDVPMETDIDDFPEEGLPEDEEPIRNELQGFALPVMVLETDMDSIPEQEASSAGRLRAERGSLEVELGTREGLFDELFPHGGEGEAGTESWRGGYPRSPMENSSDSLDRRSGASSSCSSYYSPSTAKLLTDCCSDQDQDQELAYKRQLMESLRKKLGVLREAQRGLLEDIRANTQLGEEVESLVVSVCKPSEVDKFRMFIGDLDKVVSLLLSLSGRLLRAESSLHALEPHTAHSERLPLLEKKQHLLEQLAEAQGLKEHVDRREQAVARALALRLAPEQHRDYSHFVKMKGALLVEQRQLEDKIRLGEEQLRGLRESLGLGLGMGLGLGYGHY